jgi:hypothetical protein
VKRLLAGAGGVAIVALAVPTAASAHTSGVTKCTASFTAHPENANPVWANDTFTRTTRFHDNHDGTWKVHIADHGHFTTVPGTKSDSGDTIQHEVTGSFTGSGDYTVTSASGPTCVANESYSGSEGPSTGIWPKHYFGDGATATGIDPWSWLYRTCREYMLEDSVKGTVGHITGKRCGKPTPTPTPTDTGTVTPTPTPSESTPPGEAPVPTPVNTDLPVTG